MFFACEGGGAPKPKLMLEDYNSFDVESWLCKNLSGTECPVICCISSCRINEDALEETTHRRECKQGYIFSHSKSRNFVMKNFGKTSQK